MSADNGIYILESEGPEWRVVHAQAIENINWNPETRTTCDSSFFNNDELKSYFGRCEVFTSKDDAVRAALAIEGEIAQSDFPVLEYGISFIHLPRKFPV